MTDIKLLIQYRDLLGDVSRRLTEISRERWAAPLQPDYCLQRIERTRAWLTWVDPHQDVSIEPRRPLAPRVENLRAAIGHLDLLARHPERASQLEPDLSRWLLDLPGDDPTDF